MAIEALSTAMMKKVMMIIVSMFLSPKSAKWGAVSLSNNV